MFYLLIDKKSEIELLNFYKILSTVAYKVVTYKNILRTPKANI